MVILYCDETKLIFCYPGTSGGGNGGRGGGGTSGGGNQWNGGYDNNSILLTDKTQIV